MHPKLKSFLIVCAKNAVNAILTNAALMALIHDQFNFANHSGWVHVLKAAGAAVAAREALVWGPKLLAWSTSGQEQTSSAAAGKP